MQLEKIKELLINRFSIEPKYPKVRHIIFWYDSDRSFEEIVDELELDNVKIVKVEKGRDRKDNEIFTNIFSLKYTLEVEDIESNYLLYLPYEKPEKKVNWLLDIEMYSELFRADKIAMQLEELELNRHDNSISKIMTKYKDFFNNSKRRSSLKKYIDKDSDGFILELSIIASLIKASDTSIEEISKTIILNQDKLDDLEKYVGIKRVLELINDRYELAVDSLEQFIKTIIVVHLYKSSSASVHENLKNYYNGKKHLLYILADDMLQNIANSQKFRELVRDIGIEMKISQYINLFSLEELIGTTIFEFSDKLIIVQLADKLKNKLMPYSQIDRFINLRLDSTLWKEEYLKVYKALLIALKLIQIKEEFSIDNCSNLKLLIERYTKSYYKIDRYYREFYENYREIKNSELGEAFEEIEQDINYFYSREYLSQLLEEWSGLLTDNLGIINRQRDFYSKIIEKQETRTVVIISDALRYEVAVELKERLAKKLSYKSIDISPMFSSLPSITPLGMAALLPHDNNIQIEDSSVIVKGIPSNNCVNRDKILKLKDRNSSAITYEEFTDYKRGEQEEFVKGKKIIYIYHDKIDNTSHTIQKDSFLACRQTINELTDLSKLLSSLGIVNTFITSDHGFLYEEINIEEADKLELKGDYQKIAKRYAITDKNLNERGTINLPLDFYNEKLEGVFPIKAQRIKASGNGLNFVHGGISPQEMLIPIINFKAGVAATRARKVQCRLRETIGRITSSLSKFDIYQLEAVNNNEKIIERDIKVALFNNEDIKVSNEETIRLNSLEDNSVYSVKLTLKGENNKELTLKLIDLETNDVIDSKKYNVSLSIANDFDF